MSRLVRVLRWVGQRPWLIAPAIALFTGLVVGGLRSGGLLYPLEISIYDAYLELSPRPTDSDPRIVVIQITEADIRRLGTDPIADATIADALRLLTSYRAAVIGLDVIRDIPVPPGTRAIARCAAK